MKNIVFGLTLLAAVVRANPVVETIISEVGLYPDSSAWLELHFLPNEDGQDLTGWRIVTSTSACTLSCWLGPWDFIVVDSSLLAGRDSAHGTFRLNPVTDTVVVYRDTSPYPFDMWVYSPESAVVPVPSVEASTSFWNEDAAMSQSLSWWPDSTPTPGYRNDDYGVITGAVFGVGGARPTYAWVYARGRTGRAEACDWVGARQYTIRGLAAGKYEVSSYAEFPGGGGWAFYAESVMVGYSDSVAGIDLEFPYAGVAESWTTPVAPRAGAAVVFDALGRRVTEPRGGVYFVRPANGLPVRKVVIAR
jgi:hypothetical protein